MVSTGVGMVAGVVVEAGLIKHVVVLVLDALGLGVYIVAASRSLLF